LPKFKKSCGAFLKFFPIAVRIATTTRHI
jgi:hypothetical protein